MAVLAKEDRHHARVRVGDDLDRDLFELQRGAPHEVGAQADAPVGHGRDREQRLLLVPARVGDDPAGRPEVVLARVVVRAGVPVPIAEVVDAVVLEEEVEHGLLPPRIGAEPDRRAHRPVARPDRERHEEGAAALAPREDTTALVVSVRETIRLDVPVGTLRKEEYGRHQNDTPVRRQLRYATSQAATRGTSLAAVPRIGSQRRLCTQRDPSL